MAMVTSPVVDFPLYTKACHVIHVSMTTKVDSSGVQHLRILTKMDCLVTAKQMKFNVYLLIQFIYTIDETVLPIK